MGIDNPVHLLFIGVIALIVLGPKRLPALARALGEGIREFRTSLAEGAESGIEDPTEPLASEPSAAGVPSAAATQDRVHPPPDQGAASDERQ